jgi:Recombinase zinc beta ribbon domain
LQSKQPSPTKRRLLELGAASCSPVGHASNRAFGRQNQKASGTAPSTVFIHKGESHPGEHEAIVDRKLWDKVQGVLQESPRKRAAHCKAQTPALLKGILFGPDGSAMTPTHTRRHGRLYCYYVYNKVLKKGAEACRLPRIPAGEIEAAVIQHVRALLRAPEIVRQTWRTSRASIPNLTEAEVRDALERFDPLWGELFPAEQAGIVNLLVERVDLSDGGADSRLRSSRRTERFGFALSPGRHLRCCVRVATQFAGSDRAGSIQKRTLTAKRCLHRQVPSDCLVAA